MKITITAAMKPKAVAKVSLECLSVGLFLEITYAG
jgi:hypothetical protein